MPVTEPTPAVWRGDKGRDRRWVDSPIEKLAASHVTEGRQDTALGALGQPATYSGQDTLLPKLRLPGLHPQWPQDQCSHGFKQGPTQTYTHTQSEAGEPMVPSGPSPGHTQALWTFLVDRASAVGTEEEAHSGQGCHRATSGDQAQTGRAQTGGRQSSAPQG